MKHSSYRGVFLVLFNITYGSIIRNGRQSKSSTPWWLFHHSTDTNLYTSSLSIWILTWVGKWALAIWHTPLRIHANKAVFVIGMLECNSTRQSGTLSQISRSFFVNWKAGSTNAFLSSFIRILSSLKSFLYKPSTIIWYERSHRMAKDPYQDWDNDLYECSE